MRGDESDPLWARLPIYWYKPATAGSQANAVGFLFSSPSDLDPETLFPRIEPLLALDSEGEVLKYEARIGDVVLTLHEGHPDWTCSRGVVGCPYVQRGELKIACRFYEVAKLAFPDIKRFLDRPWQRLVRS